MIGSPVADYLLIDHARSPIMVKFFVIVAKKNLSIQGEAV